MKNSENLKGRLSFEPLTPDNWDAFVSLFGDRGACAGCWCMYYRTDSKTFAAGQKKGINKEKMHELVRQGKQVGLLGMLEGKAVGWCALSPREDFSRLERSRIHKRIDEEPVWSVPCFFIHKNYRGTGVSGEMLRGAIMYADKNGSKILEGYPVIPVKGRIPNAFAWFGIYKTFRKAGFETVSRKSTNRPMVRYYTEKAKWPAGEKR